ncbi:MAG TPA: hypothetical protein VFS40_07270 [Gemmatimonadales bacterium]|nr:hypothetical protein [Gemmatimonadales bacterium]
MGELARGDQKWDVYLETRAWADVPGRFHKVNARLHFVGAGRRRSTAWIFIEPSEQALLQRFAMFSATELWKLVESLS